MKKLMLASASCVLMFASAAQAQCSSWDNTMDIAQTMGDPDAILDAVLSDDTAFLFFASSGDGTAGFTVDGQGVLAISPWSEDGNGTASLQDTYGHTCTIECDGNGGIVVTIEGSGFDKLAWNVRASGQHSMPGDVCGCSGSTMSQAQNVPCTTANCNATLRCRPGTPGGYCQPGTTPV